MTGDDDFLPDPTFDRLIAAALRGRAEHAASPDLAARAVRLGRGQERVQLQEALQQRLAQWERRKWWQRGASAVAAVLVIALLYFGAERLKKLEAAKAENAGSVAAIDDTTSATDATLSATVTYDSTSSFMSSDGPLVLGGIALLGAIALLTVGRSLGGGDQNWAFATVRLT